MRCTDSPQEKKMHQITGWKEKHVNAEKAFNKFQLLFMTKVLWKVQRGTPSMWWVIYTKAYC